MVERTWRLHPILRILAGVLALLCGAGVVVAVFTIPAAPWLSLALLAPAIILGRLFTVAAWTGEEPPVDFDT